MINADKREMICFDKYSESFGSILFMRKKWRPKIQHGIVSSILGWKLSFVAEN